MCFSSQSLWKATILSWCVEYYRDSVRTKLIDRQIGSYLAFPSFNNTFGNIQTENGPGITASWQAAITNAAYIGEILGLAATGVLVDHYGNKKIMGLVSVGHRTRMLCADEGYTSGNAPYDRVHLHLLLWQVSACTASRPNTVWNPLVSNILLTALLLTQIVIAGVCFRPSLASTPAKSYEPYELASRRS